MSRSNAEQILEKMLDIYPYKIHLEAHWTEALLVLLENRYIKDTPALEIILDALNWGEGEPLRLALRPQSTMSNN